jgi:hypothetical protein
MIELSTIQSDMRAAIGNFPVTFVFDGKSYTGGRSSIDAETIATKYGALEGYEFSIRAIKADFETLPKSDDSITINNKERFIADVEEDSLGVSILIHLTR